MPLYWLVYRRNNQISVVIEPGASLIHARMRAALGGALIKLYGNDHVLAQEIHKQDGQELPKNRYDGYP